MNVSLYLITRLWAAMSCAIVGLLAIATSMAYAQEGAGISTQTGARAIGTVENGVAIRRTATVAVIQTVFNDLVRAINDPAVPPRLDVTDSSRVTVAAYFPGERVVRLDIQLFEVCRMFGRDSLNALAVVLGHELAHCYRGFRAAREFGNGAYRRDLQRMTYEQIVSEETEADLYGGFYGRIAGYDATRMTPALLEKVYETFGIPDTLQDYLPKPERKAIAVRVESQLARLLPVFDAANLLALTRQYPEAQRCYDHVIHYFPSRELFNNAGVVYALQALKIMDADDLQFVYPLELDADSRLRGTDVLNGRIDRGTRSPSAADSILIARLLDSAEARFRNARIKDQAYAPALINLATVYILKHEYRRAIDTAAAAMALDAGRMTRILGITVQSIAQSRMALADRARESLWSIRDDARNLDAAAMVEANLAVLEKRDYRIPGGLGTGSPGETIQGIRASDTAVLMPSDGNEEVGGEFGLRIMSKLLPDCTILRAQKGKAWAQFICTADWYDGATRLGIKLAASTGEDVKRLYGDRPRVVNARQGVFYIYEYSKVMFLINPEGRVVRWVVYAVG